MAEVTKTAGHDGKPRYQTRVYVGGKQRMITARNKTELAQMERELRAEHARGTLTDKKIRLGVFMERWLADRQRECTPATYLSYQWHYDHHIKGALGHLLLSELKAWMLQPWLNELPTTDKKHRCRAILRACLATAVAQGLLVQNPAEMLDVPTLRRKPKRAWTLEQSLYFLQVAAGHHYALYFQLALLMPVRPSELRGLRWSAIDLDAGTLTVCEVRAQYGNVTYTGDTKTPSSARTFGIGPEAIEVLKRWKVAQNALRLRLGPCYKGEDYVLTGPEGGPIDYRELSRQFTALVQLSGLPSITLYQLRHTVISVLADAGESMKVISELAGHSNTQTTMNVYMVTRRGQHKQALRASPLSVSITQQGAERAADGPFATGG